MRESLPNRRHRSPGDSNDPQVRKTPNFDGKTAKEEWKLFVDEKPPEGRILLCGDCIDPADIVAYCDGGRCFVLDLAYNTCKVSTKKYLAWRLRGDDEG